MANNLLSGALNWGGLFGVPSVSDIGGLFSNKPQPNYPPVSLMSQIPGGAPPPVAQPVYRQAPPRTAYESMERYIPPHLRGMIPSWPDAFQSPQQTALAAAQVFGPQADMLAMKTSAANTMRSLLDESLPWSERAKGGLLGSAYTAAALPMMFLPGTIAWHGGHKYAPESGYPHGRPDLKHMGTGEGPAAFGWGHYAGGAKGTGQTYRDALITPPTVKAGTYAGKKVYAADLGEKALEKFGAATEVQRARINTLARNYTSSYWERAGKPLTGDPVLQEAFLDSLLRSEKRLNTPPYTGDGEGVAVVEALQEMPVPTLHTLKPSLYKYDIPDADTAKFLDYDALLVDQPQNVQDALKKLGFWPEGMKRRPSQKYPSIPSTPSKTKVSIRGVEIPFYADKLRGGDVLQRMHFEWGKEATARALQREGVPGQRYKDQLSRPLKEGGTHNYVTWDQDVLNRTKILEIDDQPVSSLLADVPASAREAASQVTVPFHKQGLLWSPMEGGSKAIHGGEVTKTVPLVDPSEMSARIIPTGDLLPRKIVSPEGLQGSILVPAVGDRTRAGGLLTHINEVQLDNPVLLEGGPDFMRDAAAQVDDVIWASGPEQVERLAQQARELGSTGKDINFVYSAAGGRNADFSNMMLDAILEQIPSGNITKKTLRRFNRAMKKRDPSWPGIDDPDVGQYLRSVSGDTRKIFLETAALKKWQEDGFPDFTSTRFAITEPELLGVPTGSSGYAISRMDPTGRVVTDPKIPHQTYPVQLGGQGYVGGLLEPVPREVMFPDFFAARRAADTPPRADEYSFLRSGGNIAQSADQQWLDSIMKYLERGRQAR